MNTIILNTKNTIIQFLKDINFLAIFFLILILSLTIFVHELGHLFAALLLNYEINSFNIGFGNTLFNFKIDNIDFSLKLFLLGGYVELKDASILKNYSFLENLFFYSSGILMNYFIFKLIVIHKVEYKEIFLSFISLKINKTLELLSKNEKENNSEFQKYVYTFAYINFTFVLFNILPLYPLDGGKILFDILDRIIIDEHIINIFKIISLSFFACFFILSNIPEKYIILFKNQIKNNFIFEYKDYINNKEILETIYFYNKYYLNKHLLKTNIKINKLKTMIMKTNIKKSEIEKLFQNIENNQMKTEKYIDIQKKIVKYF